jgi:hypothetical protein
MEQRQLRLGDTLDDYCPRERRLTNHAIVAMIGPDVKQTRCTTCDAEHEYKHAKVPRQRRKPDSPAALYSQVLAGAPKRVVHDGPSDEAAGAEPAAAVTGAGAAPADLADGSADPSAFAEAATARESEAAAGEQNDSADADDVEPDDEVEREEGPVHRPLIRASLPRIEGQPPPTRPAPEFTIRQPAGRQNRFRPRHARGGAPQFQSNRSNGNGGPPSRGGMPRQGGGRPPQGQGGGRPPQNAAGPRGARRDGVGRKRSK